MKPYDRDSTANVCLRGLKRDCGGDFVSGATIKAAIYAPNKTAELQGDVDILPNPPDPGAYSGTIPVTDVGNNKFVYIRITIDDGADFRTTIWEPRVVRDRPAA